MTDRKRFDLTEYYTIYIRDLDSRLDVLRQCLRRMADTPDDHNLVNTAARAAHSIKGASWTMRDTPMLLNDEPPDRRFDHIAEAAEHLEMLLQAVLQGLKPLDPVLLAGEVTRLEAEITAQRRSLLQNEAQAGEDRNMSGQILIVDDDELFRKLMITYFQRTGLTAHAVRGGEEAFQFLRTESAPIDLILLDIAMPHQNGFEFAKLLRADSQISYIPIIAVTARTGPEIEYQAKEAGIDRLIAKPPDSHALRDLCIELGLLAP